MEELSIKNSNSLHEIRELARKEGEKDISLLSVADILINIKKIETFLASYKDAVKKIGIKELDSITEKQRFRIAKGTTTRYDYSNNDSWVNLSEQIKAHEAFLKSLKKPLHEVDDDGVIHSYYPPVKRESDRITITEIQ